MPPDANMLYLGLYLTTLDGVFLCPSRTLQGINVQSGPAGGRSLCASVSLAGGFTSHTNTLPSFEPAMIPSARRNPGRLVYPGRTRQDKSPIWSPGGLLARDTRLRCYLPVWLLPEGFQPFVTYYDHRISVVN